LYDDWNLDSADSYGIWLAAMIDTCKIWLDANLDSWHYDKMIIHQGESDARDADAVQIVAYYDMMKRIIDTVRVNKINDNCLETWIVQPYSDLPIAYDPYIDSVYKYQDSIATMLCNVSVVPTNTTDYSAQGDGVHIDVQGAIDLADTLISKVDINKDLIVTYSTDIITYEQPFDPSDIANMVLWLDADLGLTLSGADVTTWADQSTQGNDVTQGTTINKPDYSASSLNGHGTIVFDGTDDFLDDSDFNDLSSVAGFTAFVVYDNEDRTNALLMGCDGLQWALQHSNNYMNVWAEGFNRYSIPIADTTWKYTTTMYDGAESTDLLRLKYRVNGVDKAMENVNAVPSNTGVGDGFMLGDVNALGVYWQGSIAEVIVYAAILTPAQITQVEDYLSTKYGL